MITLKRTTGVGTEEWNPGPSPSTLSFTLPRDQRWQLG